MNFSLQKNIMILRDISQMSGDILSIFQHFIKALYRIWCNVLSTYIHIKCSGSRELILIRFTLPTLPLRTIS